VSKTARHGNLFRSAARNVLGNVGRCLTCPEQHSELGQDVILRCQRSDSEALTQFVECYERRVFAYLSRALGRGFSIEDLAQEVFVRASQSLVRFDVGRKAKVSTWLLTIAYRVGVDARRRRRQLADELEPEQHPSQEPNPEQMLGKHELRMAIARAVAALPAEQPPRGFAKVTVVRMLAVQRSPRRTAGNHRWAIVGMAALLVSGVALGWGGRLQKRPPSTASTKALQFGQLTFKHVPCAVMPSVPKVTLPKRSTAGARAAVAAASTTTAPVVPISTPKIPGCQCQRGFSDVICDCY